MSHAWMPLYIADYLSDTSHLNAQQSGAYLHLIMHYWQHKSLPDNEAALARVARLTPAEWKRERVTLQAFFHDGWKHKRIDAELADADAIVSAKSSAGKAGAAARWQRRGEANGKRNGSRIADASNSQWQTDAPLPSPSQEGSSEPSSAAPERIIPHVAPSQASGAVRLELVSEKTDDPPDLQLPAILDRRSYPEDFEALWAEYRPIASPNATKADAHRAWARLSAVDREACWTGLVRYAVWVGEERAKRPDTPVKHLATFINKRGWEPFLEVEHAAAG